MKPVLFSLMLASALHASAAGPSWGKACWGSVILTTQAHVDAFSCSWVSGSLWLGTEGSDPIVDLTPLSVLTFVDRNLDIRGNEALASLVGLHNLTTVGGRFILTENPALTSLSGLRSLATVGDGMLIHRNHALASLAGLDSLTDVGDDLAIVDNRVLTSLTALETLTAVPTSLILVDNPALASLAGLHNLVSVGHLALVRNHALTSLQDLGALSSLSGQLQIWDNDALVSLDGLEKLTSLLALDIRDNGALASCSCGLKGLISDGVFSGVLGTLVIADNAPGGACESPERVLTDACRPTAVENPEDLPTACALAQNYPNPFNPRTEIRFDLPEALPVLLAVYDLTGREVARLVEGPRPAGTHRVAWEADALPGGVYLYRLTAGAFREGKVMTLLR